jgi:hypothetical protein
MHRGHQVLVLAAGRAGGHALLPKDTTQFGTAQDCEQVGQPREKFKRLFRED